MKKQITSVSVLQTSKVFAVLYFVFSLLLALPVALAMKGVGGIPAGAMLMIPVLYLVCGFIFTVIGAGIYNLVARMTGGIEFTISEVQAG